MRSALVVAVTGTRRNTRRGVITAELARLLPDIVLVGDASGVDTEATQWCRETGGQGIVFVASWPFHGKTAGPLRNREMAVIAKLLGAAELLAVPDAQSRGTISCIKAFEALGIKVRQL